jgi:TolA-binding protein
MAILEFDKVIKKYPGAEKAPASLLKQGFAFEKLGSVKEAAVLLQEVADKYPKSPEASIAKKRLASIKSK